MARVLVTGAAGFIGFHLASRLLDEGHTVVGVDNINDYYDINLKNARLAELAKLPEFSFERVEIADLPELQRVFRSASPNVVVNLAAQVGVRYSLENPQAYIKSNLVGFGNILECCRTFQPEHLLYASSSSVYGANTEYPYSVEQSVDHPISLYAATKKSNELMAHSYSHLYGLPTTGLRFFTVYGPWGRPDMAPYLFTKAIYYGEPIKVFNNGDMRRDFTYVDDIVDGIVRLMDKRPEPNPNWDSKHPHPGTSHAPYRVYNIGNNRPVELMHFIKVIEEAVGKKAIMEMMPMQPGDVMATAADIDDLRRDTGFEPKTSLEEGIPQFVEWFKEYEAQRAQALGR